jgi:drug/metabolite transporter (DMT)-like permease
MQLAIALVVTLVSSCCLNAGYLIEHQVASKLPPLSARHPLSSVKLLVAQRRWLLGFGIEALGWILYVVALGLAPLSLVQATAAGGIGILAVMVSTFTGAVLSLRERLGVVVSITGLILLGVSLVGGHEEGDAGSYLEVGLWLAGSAAAAALAIRVGGRLLSGGATFGLATGILFAAGDVATKTTVSGGGHLVFAPALVAAYALGTIVLQSGFQRGGPLTTAGIATLFTNALPIVAGMTIFGEPLPGGWAGAVRIVAFAMVVIGAVGLARPERPAEEPGGEPESVPVRG